MVKLRSAGFIVGLVLIILGGGILIWGVLVPNTLSNITSVIFTVAGVVISYVQLFSPISSPAFPIAASRSKSRQPKLQNLRSGHDPSETFMGYVAWMALLISDLCLPSLSFLLFHSAWAVGVWVVALLLLYLFDELPKRVGGITGLSYLAVIITAEWGYCGWLLVQSQER